MQTYNVYFRTDADYANHEFKARSPRAALKKALAFYERRPEELMFESYDGGHPVNEIAVCDEHGNEAAVWHDDDMRLRFAARDLLDAGELALRELRGFHSDGESEAVRILAAAIAKAKGEAASRTTCRQPPPDPETMNGDRAEWAAAALRHFQCMTDCDYEDSLGDLLRDLMHWSDRNNFDFACALFRAKHQYAARTAGGQP